MFAVVAGDRISPASTWWLGSPESTTSISAFDGALTAWRAGDGAAAATQHEQSERLLARVGTGALAIADTDGESDADFQKRKSAGYDTAFVGAAAISQARVAPSSRQKTARRHRRRQRGGDGR